VFENIIAQGAADQLRDDILAGQLAPSMLFFGPSESGKGSTALELARVLSCEESASWKCTCSACESHRYLQHSDLLILGPRSFSQEISACSSVLINKPSVTGAKILFIRSVRKLQIRFSAVLMEGDSKLGSLSALLQSLEEGISELWNSGKELPNPEKLCKSIVKDSLALAAVGISSNIPVEHIRRAAYWCRLAPHGKRKTLLIENADNMRDDARNSLLKLLEEPPVTVNIILTSQRREVIIPTILSRLRPYRFLRRGTESEKEVLRRVFQESLETGLTPKDSEIKGSLISAYLDSFLQQNMDKLYPLAVYFITSFARITALSVKKTGNNLPWLISSLGERYAPLTGTDGFDRSLKIDKIVKNLLEKSGNFEDGSFSRFLKLCLDLISDVTRNAVNPEYIKYNDIIIKYIKETETAVCILNQSKAIALEALLHNLKKSVTKTVYS
jgi:DNA polymerase-3 subunit gamma/tau